MYEPDDQIIAELAKAYFDHLPKRLSETRDSNERRRLTEQREKIAHMLERGYGLQLSPSNPAPAPLPGRVSLAERQATPPLKRRIVFASAPKRAIMRTQDNIEVPTVNLRARGELAGAIHKLRREYHLEIPEKLAGTVTESERKALVARSVNIRSMLERGYSAELGTREEVLEIDRKRSAKRAP